MFLKELKLLKLAIPFILGNLFATQLKIPLLPNFFTLLCIFLLIFLSFIPFKYRINKKWIPNTAVFFSIAIFSFISSYSKLEKFHVSHFSKLNAPFHILKITSINEKKNSIQCFAEIKAVINKESKLNACGKTILYFNKNAENKQFNIDDIILTNAHYDKVNKVKNPHQFDYAKYLMNQSIFNTFFLNKKNWIKLNKQENKTFSNKLISTKELLQNKIKKIIFSNDSYAVASALILGDKSNLSPEVKENFQKTGGMHVLAVSGLHVGLISVLLIFIFRFNARKPYFLKYFQAFIIISGIWTYSLLTGLPDSAFRAAIMASLYIFAKAINKKTNGINILLAAFIISLFIEPLSYYQVGFQFSYLALLSILLFYRPIANLFITKYSWFNKFWNLNALSISAQILIAPLSIYYFSIFPIYFLLTNLFAINFASIILYSHVFYFLIEMIEQVFFGYHYCSKIIAFYINIELDSFLKILSIIKNIPGSASKILLNQSEVTLLYIIILMLSLMFFRKKIFFGMLALILTACYFFHRTAILNNKLNKKCAVIYYLKKGHIVDFKLNDTIYSLQKPQLDSSEMAFNVFPNRNYYENKNIVPIHFNENHLHKNIYKRDYLLQFQSDQYLIFSDDVPLDNMDQSYPVDYALIQDFEAIELLKIEKIFHPKEYIFLYNKNYKLIQEARAFCIEQDRNCHFINSDYAKTINYEKELPILNKTF